MLAQCYVVFMFFWTTNGNRFTMSGLKKISFIKIIFKETKWMNVPMEAKTLQYVRIFFLFISFTERSCVLYATVSWIVTAHAIHRSSKDAQRVFFSCSHITNGDRSTLNNVSVNRGTCLRLGAKLFLIGAIGIDGLDLFFLL